MQWSSCCTHSSLPSPAVLQTGWIDSGAPQARIFIQMYHRPGYEGDDAELSHHPDSFARQKLIVNSISTAVRAACCVLLVSLFVCTARCFGAARRMCVYVCVRRLVRCG